MLPSRRGAGVAAGAGTPAVAPLARAAAAAAEQLRWRRTDRPPSGQPLGFSIRRRRAPQLDASSREVERTQAIKTA
eukprot:119605-Chlamydomonas_euryale.AAC.2